MKTTRFLCRHTRTIWKPFLALFPREFQRSHGQDLLELMQRRTDLAAHRSGLPGIARLWTEEVADLLLNAARQRTSFPKWRPTMLPSFIQDLRFAARSLLKRPAFFCTALLMLALAIGANTAVFSVVNSVLLKPLPYRDAQELVMIWSRWKDFPKTWVSIPEYRYYYQNSDSFEDMALFTPMEGANLTGTQGPQHVEAVTMTPNLFQVLDVKPVRGRAFTEGEAKQEEAVAMVSYELWQTRYGGEDIVGRKVTADGRPFTVIGVAPAGFRLPINFGESQPVGLFYTAFIDLQGPVNMLPMGGSHGYFVVARLRENVSSQTAGAELKGISGQLTEKGVYPRSWNFEPLVIPMHEDIVGTVEPVLLLLMGAVGFILLIVCANVANLLLARAQSRSRELALRTALGAGRLRLLSQLLAESLMLALTGGLAGLALAFLALKVLLALRPAELPRTEFVGLDPTVLLFTLSSCVITALLFGLVPAARTSRVNPIEALKEGDRGGLALSQRKHQAVLSAIQVALAVVLLVGAGLMLRSLNNLISIDPGFEVENRLSLQVSLPGESYPQGSDVSSFYQRFLKEIEALPGVESASAVRFLPLATQIGDSGVRIKGYASPDGLHPKGDWQIVSPGYFETMGIRLVRGRFFTPSDGSQSPDVVIINETMARTYWPDSDPLAAEVIAGFGDDLPWMRVVGIVEDLRHNGLTAPVKEKFYRPVGQFAAYAPGAVRSMTIVVKAAADAKSLAEPIRASLRKIDPQLPLAQVRTLEEIMGDVLARQRFAFLLLGLFAVLGVVLAALGVYSLMAYGVTRRRREIGIRMTLGARARQVEAMVMSEGLRLALAGIVVGLLGAVLLTGLLESQLYGVQPHDIATFALAAALFLTAAMLGSLIPARKAAALDPSTVLREE